MFVNKQNLNPEEIEMKEGEYVALLRDNSSRKKTWEELRDFFDTQINSDSEIVSYYSNYWRWYVDLTWRNLDNLELDYFISEVAGKQIVSAILLDYEVQDKILWYLGLNVFGIPETQSAYFKIKNNFLESEMIVGEFQGRTVVIKDLVEEISLLNKKEERDSMAEAEFANKLLQLFVSNKDPLFEKYILTDLDTAVDRFIGLVHFFMGVDEDHIWYMVDAFMDPTKYEGSEADNSLSTSEPAEEVKDNKIEEESVPGNEQAIIVESQKSLTAEQTPVVEPQARLTTGQVKSQIESEFKKDSEGNFEDIEGVMGRLSELAEENNDPSIAEMIYFDEEGNKFKWKE